MLPPAVSLQAAFYLVREAFELRLRLKADGEF